MSGTTGLQLMFKLGHCAEECRTLTVTRSSSPEARSVIVASIAGIASLDDTDWLEQAAAEVGDAVGLCLSSTVVGHSHTTPSVMNGKAGYRYRSRCPLRTARPWMLFSKDPKRFRHKFLPVRSSVQLFQ